MATSLRSLLWHALISLSCIVAAAAYEQHTFGAPTTASPGILRRFTPDSQESLRDILRLAQAHELDIWQIGHSNTPYVDIYSPQFSPSLPIALLSTPHSLSNITIPEQSPRTQQRHWGLNSLAKTKFHNDYHPQYEVDEFIDDLAKLHPDKVTVLRLGHSSEGRELLGLKISARGNGTKLGFVVTGPQHAREWVATSTALYFAHALLADPSDPKSLAYLLKVYEFHIVPSPNPDGYVYTWDTDRFWYKNRQIVGPGAQCIGIDMNRNWGYKWKAHADFPMLQSANKKKNEDPADPCSVWYPGHRPFEAAEVNNIANYITKVSGVHKGAGKGGIVAILDLRSYGQMLAAPYSYSCDKMPNDAENQMEALEGAAQAGKAAHGTPFVTGTLCELLYQCVLLFFHTAAANHGCRAPGNILDYVYNTARIRYAYSAFLRDTGTYGFTLPREWIRPVGEETGGIIAYIAKFIATKRGIEF
ncbi:peptidase M14 [Mycena pura]|uniref:Inactive metallocarboxypeptidase ECM14 n=1 Tax=Mycena pura TaxID=153505 RepID=A0AAD6UUT7_9AGAR|nr:peptidase M14 [Mycena pura]